MSRGCATTRDEAQDLFQDLLIGVTQFFRDPVEFGILEREVFPELLAGKTAADTLRIWVLGCATGEEAYSLAMLLREAMARLDTPPHRADLRDRHRRAVARGRADRPLPAGDREGRVAGAARAMVHEGGRHLRHPQGPAGDVHLLRPQRHQGRALLPHRPRLLPEPADLPQQPTCRIG
jgi:hypothetical protein